MQRGTPDSEAIDLENNQPYILKLFDADSDIASQYFIVIEQSLMIECSNMMSALFSLFAVHYVFNIQYHTRLKDFFQLIEDKVIGMKTSNKKTAVFLSVTTAAECYLASGVDIDSTQD